MNFGWINTISQRHVLILTLFISIIVSCLQYRLPLKSFDGSGAIYTHYNNYVIFKLSHFHLLDGTNIYAEYPDAVHDIFKYSPAFALLFGLFSRMPDLIGLNLWNILNTVVLVLALMYTQALWNHKKGWLLLFILPEIILTTQHAQSNALMTGLLVFAYFDFEKNKSWRAGIWIALAFFIKIYAGLACVLFLLYKDKSKFVASFVVSSAILSTLPLVATSSASLWMQYQSWGFMLTHDHAQSYGLSLMHILNLLFPAFHAKAILQLIGLAILVVVSLKFLPASNKKDRLDVVSVTLLSLIIFNHKSESATFIVAVVAIAIWFFSMDVPSFLEKSLLFFAWIGTVLIASDLFPPFLRNSFFVPYSVKVWPCILIYIYILYTIFLKKAKLHLSP